MPNCCETGAAGGSCGCAAGRAVDDPNALRETVRAVLEGASTDADGAASLINHGLRQSRATPALRHDHDRWWTEVASDTDRCSAHLAAIIRMAEPAKTPRQAEVIPALQ